jgi:diaminopimelate epimerase
VPFVGEGPWVEAPVQVGDDVVNLTCVGLGNPHAVALVEVDPDTLPWRRWGAALETHRMFPNRTNVQFARALARDRVEARIWERGAGETMASGSSACAVAAAAVRTGRCAPGWITVQMPGGSLRVEVRTDGALRLEGPVERVGRIHVDKAWLAARGTDA